MCIAEFIAMYFVVSPCFATICTSVACVIAIAWHVMLVDRDCFHDCGIAIFLIMHCVRVFRCCLVSYSLLSMSPCLCWSSLLCNSDVFQYVKWGAVTAAYAIWLSAHAWMVGVRGTRAHVHRAYSLFGFRCCGPAAVSGTWHARPPPVSRCSASGPGCTAPGAFLGTSDLCPD